MKKGKKHIEALKLVDRTNKYPIEEALELMKKVNYAKFDATVEVAYRLNVDPRKAEQNLRGAVVLPHGTGKVSRVVVIAQGEKAQEARDAGADFVGDDELISKIGAGWLDFDVMVATPDMMAKLGRYGRLLGPRGLMPNPKTGTVTTDITKAVHEIKNGKVEYRVDKFGNIHAAVGRVSFDNEKLIENIKTMTAQMLRIKPQTVRGVYVRNVTISSTMGPGIRVDLETIK
ncbi:MAG TPA: 50S ribosomal protein L1 [Acholeplasmataceae bacterium]|nr:50S ribosomal protein L1 [Acholeplasmataceae bacterium]HQC30905.1 50S ribosomal protein L1 [Acholeplasmataceae bacterium]